MKFAALLASPAAALVAHKSALPAAPVRAQASSMEMKYRVAVVGGGPSGACAAEICAQEPNIETYIIERKFDNAKPCGGAIPLCMVDEFDLPSEIIDRKVPEPRGSHEAVPRRASEIDVSRRLRFGKDGCPFDDAASTRVEERRAQVMPQRHDAASRRAVFQPKRTGRRRAVRLRRRHPG